MSAICVVYVAGVAVWDCAQTTGELLAWRSACAHEIDVAVLDIGAGELHATFLAAAPLAARISAVDRDACAPDEFAVGERVIYLRLRNGMTGSRLPDWDKQLGLRTTTRNWNTTTRLRDLAG